MTLKVTWHKAKYGDPYSEFVLPSKVHTHSSEHTAVGGSSALLKGTSVTVLKVERALYIHSPTYNSCRPENLWITSPTL